MNILSVPITVLILDMLWLYMFMGKRYKTMIYAIQGTKMRTRIWCACISYILLIVGLLLFVIPKIRKTHRVRDSFLYGGGFGLVVFGVYDFTAAAVFEKWNIQLAMIDIA